MRWNSGRLWASRAALDAARADYAAQEQKLADCRENPMLQQLYQVLFSQRQKVVLTLAIRN